MKIAVPYKNGQVFQNFGHSAQFNIQDYPQLCFMAGGNVKSYAQN